MIACLDCGRPYPATGAPHRCPTCGGLFEVEAWDFDPAQVDESQPGLWRYRHTFSGLDLSLPPVSLGEGRTPLVFADVQGQPVAFKCEFLNPTGSFKDRGSALIAAFLKSRGFVTALEDSSGNAGASFAAYAARAGLQAKIYIPAAASGPKRLQIAAYGAQLQPIPGSRAAVTAAVERQISLRAAYASHAALPVNLPGYATAAYEMFEQLGGAPGAVIVPAGQGGLLLGLFRGFQALQRAGLLSRLPRMIGVQARACPPLWLLTTQGRAAYARAAEAPTLAEGARVLHPLRAAALLALVEAGHGEFLAIEEADILRGRDELAQRGLYVEPTSALVWAALEQTLRRLPEPVSALLTGSGLKYA